MTTTEPDRLDRLLGEFYRSELARSFPPAAPRVVRRAGPRHSRMALAASVAVVLGSCFLLSGRGQAPVAGGPSMRAVEQGSASSDAVLRPWKGKDAPPRDKR